LGRAFVCFLVSLSFLVPFLLLVSFAGWRLLSELILHVTDNGWDLGNTEMTVRTRRRMAEEENRVLRTRWLGRSCGGKTAPTTTKPRIEWVRDWVRVIAALHHAIDKVEKPSLDGIRRPRFRQTSPITYQSSSHLFPSSLFCFLVLANQLSRCGYSLPTLLETKPPFFVASYGSCSAIS